MAPDLLKHLPLNTQKELLFILNASWTTGWCPQAWRTATIDPFLKKEKDPQAVSSYRPIALTSTIGKLLERLIVNRLSWWLEARSLLSPWPAGFRKRRCTTDQCLRLSQFVSDGFQSTNKERTVVVVVVVDPTPPTCCQQSPAPEIMWQPAVSPPRWQGKAPLCRELGPLSSGQGKSMQFVDPDRIEQSDHVQAASFAPGTNCPYALRLF